MGPSLPPELVDLIVQHLPKHDKKTLKNCALVARTWSSPSQRALFHDIVLSEYSIITKLLAHLICFPHLRRLIRDLTIHQHDHDDISLPAHVSCLTSVISLLPNITKFALRDVSYDESDIVATRSHLDLIPNVLENAPLVELDMAVFFVETFQRVFEILRGTNIKRVSLSGVVEEEVDSGAPRKRLYLPSLERICFGVDGLHEEFHNCLTHNFDFPNLKECKVVLDFVDGLRDWQKILRRGFPPLEVFKLELESGFGWTRHILEEDAYRPLPLAGLPFQHVHLSVNPGDLDEIRKIIEWWSSTFRALSDSEATIYFTELTFAFTDLPGIETLEAAWSSLDESLSHTMLSGVRSIHFERNFRRTQVKVTRAAYPILADKIRLALPRLASRGVLRFD